MPEKVAYFAEVLLSGFDPDRERDIRELVAAEDRLGHRLERLTLVDGHIDKTRMRIERQKAIIARRAIDGLDTRLANKVLAQMTEVLVLFEVYRRNILDRLANGVF